MKAALQAAVRANHAGLGGATRERAARSRDRRRPGAGVRAARRGLSPREAARGRLTEIRQGSDFGCGYRPVGVWTLPQVPGVASDQQGGERSGLDFVRERGSEAELDGLLNWAIEWLHARQGRERGS